MRPRTLRAEFSYCHPDYKGTQSSSAADHSLTYIETNRQTDRQTWRVRELSKEASWNESMVAAKVSLQMAGVIQIKAWISQVLGKERKGKGISLSFWASPLATLLRATSQTRLRAHDPYTSSTLIGGKGGAGPSFLHTTLEGPKEYASESKMGVKSTWIPTWHRMDHVSWSLGLFSKTTSSR